MLLVIDIGNTHITAGVFRNDVLNANWRISSTATRTADEIWFMLNMLMANEHIEANDITGCAISSVVPDQTSVFQDMVQKKLDINPVLVTSDIPVGIKICYHDPASVGPDRICNAVAGYQKYGGPLVIVDFGTATTFDVISQAGEYLGGIIAPGLESSSVVLHQHAARLPKVELRFPTNVVGRTTETSMQAGIMFGMVDMVNGLIRRINEELTFSANVIATGGIARQLADKLEPAPELNQNLTLDGLRIIYQMVQDGR